MDYGQEWETAWNRHVQEWVPSTLNDDYVHSSQYNASLEYFRTAEELKANPYPSNLQTMCIESYRRDPKQEQQQQQQQRNRGRSKHPQSSSSSSSYTFVPILRDTRRRVHCTVLDRIGGSALSSSSSSSSSSSMYVDSSISFSFLLWFVV